MQYILLLYSEEGGWSKLTPAEQERWMADYAEYMQAMTTAGVLVSANRFQPSASSKTVRVADGASQVQAGPYAESKEQLGGFFVIDVADSDAALSWAARCPAARHGIVEVRPSMCTPG